MKTVNFTELNEKIKHSKFTKLYKKIKCLLYYFSFYIQKVSKTDFLHFFQ